MCQHIYNNHVLLRLNEETGMTEPYTVELCIMAICFLKKCYEKTIVLS